MGTTFKAKLMDGKTLADRIMVETARKVDAIRQASHVTPTLATVLVGDDSASATYIRMKRKRCEQVGMRSVSVELPAGVTTEEVPHIFPIAVWEKPDEANADWQVPVMDVEDAIREAAKRFQVVEIVCDPYRWARTFQVLEDEGLPIKLTPDLFRPLYSRNLRMKLNHFLHQFRRSWWVSSMLQRLRHRPPAQPPG